jgi:protocatechuate 3,4-dioxygenase, beta subunit
MPMRRVRVAVRPDRPPGARAMTGGREDEVREPSSGSGTAPALGPRSLRFLQRRLVLSTPLGAAVAAGTAVAGAAAVMPVLANPATSAQAGNPAADGPLAPTPRQSRGPFYPTQIPADAGADLIVERAGRRARGEIVQLSGRILDTAGQPLANAQVEIWQCNANGRYHHPRDTHSAPIDPLFRGYGRVRTDADGRYAFRTIRPVPYPGRTPHIHYAVDAPQGRSLITQMYVRGEPQNERDGLLAWITPAERERLMAEFVRAGDAWTVQFDLVLG